MSGTIRVYTGNGKGKTSTALGEALNALLNDQRVFIMQFMKPALRKGEQLLMNRFPLNLVFLPVGRKGYILKKKGRDPLDSVMACRALLLAKEVMERSLYELIILDEINMAVWFKLIPPEEVISFIRLKPARTHLILTGRNLHPDIARHVDRITELKELKHYYRRGIPAREGIEY